MSETESQGVSQGQPENRWQDEKQDLKQHDELHAAGPNPANETTGQNDHGPGKILAETPDTFTGLRVADPKDSAAGLPAVTNSMKHLFSEAGVFRGTRVMLRVNQKGGIDCPSCAWPEPDGERSRFEFCESGAKAIADEATKKRIDADFFKQYSVAELSEQSDFWLGQQGRLTQPMVLREGSSHYGPISWECAFKLIADELNALKSADEAIFYTSGRTSNEAAFLYQLFVRQFGTNNMPDCSNMCHESSGSALTPTIGIGKGTVTINDFAKAQVIVIIGQNPGTNHPRMLTTLQEAKRAGAKIIAINPLREAGLLAFRNPQEVGGMTGFSTQLADQFLQVKINGDIAVLKGIMRDLLDTGAIDKDFIDQKTTGYEEFVADLRATSWDEILADSGVSREQIRDAAKVIGKSDRMIVCWAMGLTQSKHAVGAIQSIVNLLLMRGSIGKEGAGACPVRGHSNVQGDRTMGIWERPKKELLDKLQETFDFDPPRKNGFDVVESIRAMHAGLAKVFFAMGGNFLSATPDTKYTAQALRNTKLTVQVSTKLNRSHLVVGKNALILPALGRTDEDFQSAGPQFVTTENSMGVVEMSRGILEPPSENCRSEIAIIAGLAKATLGGKSKIDWQSMQDHYDRIRNLIEKCIPGCENYNDRVRQPGGFYLPNAPREGDFGHTPTGKANFTVHAIPRRDVQPNQLILMTVRSHDQFNTTIYGLHDRYRGIHNERRVIFMNKRDLRDRGLKTKDLVDITSHFEGEQRTAGKFIAIEYSIPQGCCAAYFPEANVLVPIDSVAEKSNTPSSKYVVVTVERVPQ